MGSGGKGHKFWCDKCQCYVDFSDFETCESICEYCEAREARENKARAEAAEAEVERLRAELAQARADLRVMAGLAWCGIDRRFTFSPTVIRDAVTVAVNEAEDDVLEMSDDDVMTAVRRALGV